MVLTKDAATLARIPLASSLKKSNESSQAREVMRNVYDGERHDGSTFWRWDQMLFSNMCYDSALCVCMFALAEVVYAENGNSALSRAAVLERC